MCVVGGWVIGLLLVGWFVWGPRHTDRPPFDSIRIQPTSSFHQPTSNITSPNSQRGLGGGAGLVDHQPRRPGAAPPAGPKGQRGQNGQCGSRSCCCGCRWWWRRQGTAALGTRRRSRSRIRRGRGEREEDGGGVPQHAGRAAEGVRTGRAGGAVQGLRGAHRLPHALHHDLHVALRRAEEALPPRDGVTFDWVW